MTKIASRNSFRFALFVLYALLGSFWTGRAYSQFSKNITLAGHLPYEQCLSALWGYTDPQGNEYAIVGTCTGVSVVNVSNPSQPEELYFVPGPNSIWREMKTYKHYAYCVTEAGTGLTIIDLANLPDTNLSHTVFTSTPVGSINNVHTIWIDENGKCFLYGATGFPQGGGCIVLDLEPDPANPVYLGRLGGPYFHDGFVRDDVLYASAIYDGALLIYNLDYTDSIAFEFTGARNTPGNFTHNAWPTDDSKYIFTTDEVADGFVTAYDMTDVFNIIELDRVQMDPAGSETPHNVRYLNGWLPTAYYREGVVIIDAHQPQNMIVTGYYDTFVPDTGSTFGGVWEVYPYFPSGRMIAGDRSNGLFILNPSYVRAAYLEGTVTDTSTGQPLSGVEVYFSGLMPGDTLLTAVDGTYKTGSADSGLFVITFVKQGYESKSFYVTLDNAEITIRDAALRPIGYVPPPPAGDFSDLTIWPVPANTQIEILGIPFKVNILQIADVNGKVLQEIKLDNQAYISVPLENYAAGVYYLFFRGATKKPYVRKIVVE